VGLMYQIPTYSYLRMPAGGNIRKIKRDLEQPHKGNFYNYKRWIESTVP
jgi:hypothetical protein